MASSERRISVVVRYRDYRGREHDPCTWDLQGQDTVRDATGGNGLWSFDRVYHPHEDTQRIFDEQVKEIVHHCLEGVNGTVFAYGQTASGKTFTMHGNQRDQGIIPYAVLELFASMESHPDQDYLLTVSYLEIYNENIIDLLSGPPPGAYEGTSSSSGAMIRLFDRPDGSLDIRGLTEVRIQGGAREVFDCLIRGERKRHTGETRMNERSSRSHTIFRIQLECRGGDESGDAANKVFSSVLHLVDLAGSEGLKRTGATGERRVEGANINRSLLSLTKVINQLSDQRGPNQFVGFRESQLTRILQTSLGGNAQTIIIAAASGAPSNYPETKSTLEFAARAKCIKNKVKVNVYQSPEEVLKTAMQQIEELKRQLRDMKTGTGLAVLSTENEKMKSEKEQILREKLSLEEKISEMQSNIPKILQTRPEQMTTPRKMLNKEPNRRHTTFDGGAFGALFGAGAAARGAGVFSPISRLGADGTRAKALKGLEPLGSLGLPKAKVGNGNRGAAPIDGIAEKKTVEQQLGGSFMGGLGDSTLIDERDEEISQLKQENATLHARVTELEVELEKMVSTANHKNGSASSSASGSAGAASAPSTTGVSSTLHQRLTEERDSLLSQLQHLQENQRSSEKTGRELRTRVQWLETVNKNLEQASAELEAKVEEQRLRVHDLECSLAAQADKAARREADYEALERTESAMRDQLTRMGRDLTFAKQAGESERLRLRSFEEELEKTKAGTKRTRKQMGGARGGGGGFMSAAADTKTNANNIASSPADSVLPRTATGGQQQHQADWSRSHSSDEEEGSGPSRARRKTKMARIEKPGDQDGNLSGLDQSFHDPAASLFTGTSSSSTSPWRHLAAAATAASKGKTENTTTSGTGSGTAGAATSGAGTSAPARRSLVQNGIPSAVQAVSPSRTWGQQLLEERDREKFEQSVVAQQEAALARALAAKDSEFASKLATVEEDACACAREALEGEHAERMAALERSAADLQRDVETKTALLRAAEERRDTAIAERDRLLREAESHAATLATLREEQRLSEEARTAATQELESQLRAFRDEQAREHETALREQANALEERAREEQRRSLEQLREHLTAEQDAVRQRKDAEMEEIVKNCEQASTELEAELRERAGTIERLEADLRDAVTARDFARAAAEEAGYSSKVEETAAGVVRELQEEADKERTRRQQLEETLAQEKQAGRSLQAQLRCFQSELEDGRVAQERLRSLEKERETAEQREHDRGNALQETEAREAGLRSELQRAKAEATALAEQHTSLKAESARIDAERRRELETLQGALMRAQQQVEQQDSAQDDTVLTLQQQVAKSEADVRVAEEERQKVLKERDELKNAKAQLENDLEVEQKERLEVADEAEKLLDENSKLEAELEELRTAKRKHIEWQTEKESMVEERERIEGELHAAEQEVTACKKSRDEALVEVGRRNQEICSLQGTLATESGKSDELQRETANFKIELRQTERLLTELKESVARERETFNEKEEQDASRLAALEREKQQLQDRAQKLQTELDSGGAKASEIGELRQKVLEHSSEAERWRQACESARSEVDALQKRVAEAQALKSGFVAVEGALSQARAGQQDARYELQALVKEKEAFQKTCAALEEEARTDRVRARELEDKLASLEPISDEVEALRSKELDWEDRLAKGEREKVKAEKKAADLEREIARLKESHVQDWLGSSTTITSNGKKDLTELLREEREQVERLRQVMLASEEQQESVEEKLRESEMEKKRKDIELNALREQLAVAEEKIAAAGPGGGTDSEAVLAERRLRERQQLEVERLRRETAQMRANFREASREVNDYGSLSEQLQRLRDEAVKREKVVTDLRQQLHRLEIREAGQRAQHQSVLQGHANLRSLVLQEEQRSAAKTNTSRGSSGSPSGGGGARGRTGTQGGVDNLASTSSNAPLLSGTSGPSGPTGRRRLSFGGRQEGCTQQ
ncbi:unnamed protein product [Amoebophrya sp. A25]|nr:unnamed protein product [Amoebophrya sp. A25]|eukprot:GSA25T00022456001.1